MSATFKPAGAGPWPQMACCCPVRALCNRMGQSPPGPFKCGSTICSVKPAAAAASKALPPRSNTAIPTWEAIQCVEATAPKVPMISGRVVKPRTPSFAGKPIEARFVCDMGAAFPFHYRAGETTKGYSLGEVVRKTKLSLQPARLRVRRACRRRCPWPRLSLPLPRVGRSSRKDASAHHARRGAKLCASAIAHASAKRGSSVPVNSAPGAKGG